MRALEAIGVAFGMFSRIPVPKRVWTQSGMERAIAAFPLVGVVEGALIAAWGLVAAHFALPNTLAAAGFVVLPVLVNGGIHLDGLCDTSDALSSYAPREKKLEILHDPRAGAFGVIALVIYFLLACSLYSCASFDLYDLAALGFTFVLSRALSGLAVECWPNARLDGMVASLAPAKKRRGIVVCLAVFTVLAIVCIVVFAQVTGVASVLAALVVLAWYRHVALVRFGGVTGDLAGWFLQWAELSMLAVLVLGGLL